MNTGSETGKLFLKDATSLNGMSGANAVVKRQEQLLPEALNAAAKKKHELEGKALGVRSSEDSEEVKRIPLHLAVKRYLETIEALKKPNTLRKYRAVLSVS
jgi:hypothetical protein